MYENRNCRKHFPADVNESRRTWWSAHVTVKRGERTSDINLPDTALNECPVSFITTQSLQLMELVQRNRIAKECGAPLFGPVANRWPAWFHDALFVIESANAEVHKAQQSSS